MPDILVESFDVDVGASGSTHTLTNDVGSTSSAFVKINNATDKSSGGRTDSTANSGPDDFHVGTALTDTAELTFTKALSNSMKVVGEVWRYTGAASGANEFINRGSYEITVTGTSASVAVSGISNEDNCVPFMTGVYTTEASNSNVEMTTFTVYMDGSGNVVAERNNSGTTCTVYVNVVEFTGSNWSVGHAVSSSHDSSIETVTMNTDSTGTGGSTFDVTDWETAFIEATGGGDSTETGLSDCYFLCYPAGTTTQVVVDYQSGDGSARNDASAYVHVVQNDDLIVKRNGTNQAITEGNGSYGTNIGFPTGTSTARNLNELALEWYVDTNGTGTAHARGRLATRITDATGTIRHWVHRSGNNIIARYGVIDLSQLADTGGSTTVTGAEGVITPIADSGSVTATSTISSNEGVVQSYADSGSVESTSVIIATESTIESYADSGLISSTSSIVGTESVLTPIADSGEVVGTSVILGTEGVITPIADNGTIEGVATTTVQGDEGVITSVADTGSVEQTTDLSPDEGVITPIADNGSVVQEAGETNITGNTTAGFYVDDLGNPHLQVLYSNGWFINQESQRVTPVTGNIWNVDSDTRYLIELKARIDPKAILRGIADNGTVVSTSIIAGTEGVIVGIADEATISVSNPIIGNEGVITPIADTGEVVQTTNISGNEGVITGIADSGTISSTSTISGAEGVIEAYADNGTITGASTVVATEGVIVSIADSGVVTSTAQITANEGVITAIADEGAISAPAVEVVGAEGVIQAFADNGTVVSTSVITGAEGVITPIADQANIVADATVVGNEGVLIAIGDNGTVTQTSVIVGNEGTIVGIADQATISSTSTVVGTEGVIIGIADNGTVIQAFDNTRLTDIGDYRVTSDGDYRKVV